MKINIEHLGQSIYIKKYNILTVIFYHFTRGLSAHLCQCYQWIYESFISVTEENRFISLS